MDKAFGLKGGYGSSMYYYAWNGESEQGETLTLELGHPMKLERQQEVHILLNT